MTNQETDSLTQKIIGCCYDVRHQLRPGCLEKIYLNVLKIGYNKLT